MLKILQIKTLLIDVAIKLLVLLKQYNKFIFDI